MTCMIPWRSGMPAAIVLVWLLAVAPAEGLGEGAITHGASSCATIRVDPTYELVTVMTRNAAGLNGGKDDDRFLEVVVVKNMVH